MYISDESPDYVNEKNSNEINDLEEDENVQMHINDNNINKITYNKCIPLHILENNINQNKNINTVVSIIKIEECINFIDKSKYIIDQESDDTKSKDDISDESIEDTNRIDLNSFILTKKNFKKIKDIKCNIQIYGCSHCRCFLRKSIKIGKVNIFNNFKSASSISGIINDISSLNYKSYITKRILSKPLDYHVFKLGQIDVEYIYYYKILQGIKISKENFFKDIIYKLINFLKIFINKFGSKIIICGSNMVNPINWIITLKSILRVNKLPEDITYKSKNEDIELFNYYLKKECNQNKIKYFDLTKECCFKNKGRSFIKNKYIGKDHHYKGAENIDIYNNEHSKYGIGTYYTFINSLVQNL